MALSHPVHRSFRLLIALALLVLGADFPARAQTGSGLKYGQTVTGRITSEEFRTVYTFRGNQGDIIDVLLKRTGGNLDPMLVLTDDQNTLIARDDDGAPGYDAALLSIQLKRDSLYFLIATRFGQDRGSTTGAFSVTLSRVGVISGSRTILRYGDSVVLELTDREFQYVYAFAGDRGDIIHITMQRVSGDLDSLLILADQDGNILMVNDEDPASPGTLDAAISDVRIKRTDTYLIVATRFGREAGTSRGSFSLSLNRLAPDELGKTPDKAVLIDYGGTAGGTINVDNIRRYYLIEAKKGDVITAEATRTRGNLDPALILYSGDLRQQLAVHDSGQRGRNARITAFTAPTSSTYLLVVSRFNGDKGITAGDYTLSVTAKAAAVATSKP